MLGDAAPADLRSDRPQPRHGLRLARTCRPAGRLGLGDARLRARRSSRRARPAAGRSRSTSSSRGRSRPRCEPNEIITEVRVPDPGARDERHLPEARAEGRRLRDRRGRRPASLSRTGRSSQAGIALTGVGPSNIRASAAEDALRGAEPTDEVIEGCRPPGGRGGRAAVATSAAPPSTSETSFGSSPSADCGRPPTRPGPPEEGGRRWRPPRRHAR